MRRWICASLLIIAAAAPTCRATMDSPKLKVCVSILPQAYFAERAGGERVDVTVLVGPGQSPHTYEPTPKQIAALSEAAVYFTIGMPFETALVDKVKSAFPNVLVVDTRKGIALRTVTEREIVHEAHGGETGAASGAGHDGAGRAGESDPHFWLNPRLAKIMARTISETLRQLDPANSRDYESNLAALEGDLDAIDRELVAALAPLKNREFFVYHPAFGYFADAYDLKQTAIEVEGKEPAARHLAQLIDHAKQEKVRVIFVEPQFSAKGAKALAGTIGAAVVPMDPLAKDYLANLKNAAAEIAKALAPAADEEGTSEEQP